MKRILLAKAPVNEFMDQVIYRLPDGSILIEVYDRTFGETKEIDKIEYGDKKFFKKLAKVFYKNPTLLMDFFLRHPPRE